MNAASGTFLPATQSQRRRDARLLLVDQSKQRIEHLSVSDLSGLLDPGDVLVVNDAGTIPASFQGIHQPSGCAVEVRLASNLSPTQDDLSSWLAVVFGEGNWRRKTEKRPAPPTLQVGDIFVFAGMQAKVIQTYPKHNRLVELAFASQDRSSLWTSFYRNGRPIQYSYLQEELAIWDPQTLFSGSPVAVEAPSSAFHLSWSVILDFQSRGVQVVNVTHATGLSTTGDDQLDQLLPFPERSYIREGAARIINAAKKHNKRVIAVGTGVTRALESAAIADTSRVAHGEFVSREKLHPEYHRKIVDGLLSGLHEKDSSHLQLLGSFVNETFLLQAYEQAQNKNYLGHEYGDLSLLLA